MIESKRAIALALAFGGLAATSPALAQYRTPAPAPQSTPQPPASAEPTTAGPERKFNLSGGGRKAIVELEKAVKAKDMASIPAKLAAAQAAAKTNDDKYVTARLQLQAAIDQNDNAGVGAGIEAMDASGGASVSEIVPLYLNIGKIYYNAKQYDRAARAFERALVLDPNQSEGMVMLAETRKSQGRSAEAVALLQKGIAAQVAAGQKPSETWYKRAVALAYDAKLPAAITISRDWVAAYPTPTNWRDTLRIYKNSSSGLDNDVLIDLMRLQRAIGALAGETDYYNYSGAVLLKGYPGEAKAVLDEGFAAKAIERNKPIFRDVYAQASAKTAADRASLPALEKAALAAPAAKQAMTTGDVYLGYGDYAKAAAMYRAALTKTGVDPSLANLRLGIALARSGDKAGATAAFNAVSGVRADIAKYWLLYLSTRA